MRFAWVFREGSGVVQSNAHKEHSQTPTQGTKHPLPPIVVCLVSKVCQDLQEKTLD